MGTPEEYLANGTAFFPISSGVRNILSSELDGCASSSVLLATTTQQGVCILSVVGTLQGGQILHAGMANPTSSEGPAGSADPVNVEDPARSVDPARRANPTSSEDPAGSADPDRSEFPAKFWRPWE